MAEQTALPQLGDLVAGKYRIQRKLGEGGMGAVFEARHEVTGRRFAIKWLLPEMATHGEGIERFVREARFAGGLEHPNVVDVYDVCEEPGALFMVMEFLEGESLAERLARVARFGVADTLRIALPCMRGVARAHAAGIVHRDLKPANLFICEATHELPERYKVLDFGISKIVSGPGDPVDSLTHSGSMMGTPFYMSPEQLRGRPVDHRVDVYAFGVILYQMLSGQLPFTGATVGDLVMQVLTETPKPLGELAGDAPAALIRCVERAMARQPEQRFETILQLIAALEQSGGRAATAQTSRALSQPPRSAAPAAAGGRANAGYQTRAIASPSQSELPLTPLSTESRPPPEPKPSAASKPRLLRPIWLAAIASAILTSIGVIAYWLTPPAGPSAEPHVVRPRPESAESSVSASTQVPPDPVAVPDVPAPEAMAKPDSPQVVPQGKAPPAELEQPGRRRASPRTESRTPTAPSKPNAVTAPQPAAAPAVKPDPRATPAPAAPPKNKPAATPKPTDKSKPPVPHIDLDPRQF
jgi:serine/threonine-protein kinase